jgi:hypothetical protein
MPGGPKPVEHNRLCSTLLACHGAHNGLIGPARWPKPVEHNRLCSTLLGVRWISALKYFGWKGHLLNSSSKLGGFRVVLNSSSKLGGFGVVLNSCSKLGGFRVVLNSCSKLGGFRKNKIAVPNNHTGPWGPISGVGGVGWCGWGGVVGGAQIGTRCCILGYTPHILHNIV